MYEAPNRTALNRTIWSQTKTCITKLSCEICTLLGNYTDKNCNFLPMYHDNLSAPSSNVIVIAWIMKFC